MFGKRTLFTILVLLFHCDGVHSFSKYTVPVPDAHQGRRTKQNICRIPRQSSPSSRQKQISFTAIGGIQLKLSNGNDDNEKGIPFLALALGISILLSTWPLLTFFRDVNGPTDGFDVDMFMTLKDMMGDNESVGSSSTSMLTDENYRSIVELPALSPAEQLVGAVFGPPR